MSNIRFKNGARQLNKIINSKSPHKFHFIIIFILGCVSGFIAVDFQKSEWYKADSNAKDVNICFTPPSGCAELISREIKNAQKSIYIQAFSFTSHKIAASLLEAASKNVEIQILADPIAFGEKESQVAIMASAGIPVFKDKVPGLAHNKIIIIDEKKIITGSFNFTNGADKRNAENVVFLNNAQIAKIYLENWRKRKATAIKVNF
jgi:phospholipase D